MSQTQKVQGVATSIFTDNGYTQVIYHQTIVVKFNADSIVLNSGGWRTVITKLRMNQAAVQFGLSYGVFAKLGKWYVNTPQGETADFHDEMRISR